MIAAGILAVVLSSDVTKIDIRLSSRASASTATYAATIVPRGDGFVRDDGTIVPAAAVGELVDAMTYDAGLARAIGGLLPPAVDTFGFQLRPDRMLALSWGEDIADGDEMRAIEMRDGIDSAKARAITADLGLDTDLKVVARPRPGDAAAWTGAFWFADRPKIRYEHGSAIPSPEAFRAWLQRPLNALRAVRGAAWLPAVLARHPDATVRLEDGGMYVGAQVRDLRAAGNARDAGLLAGAGDAAVSVVAEWDGGGLEWQLLPDGDFIRLHGAGGSPAGP